MKSIIAIIFSIFISAQVFAQTGEGKFGMSYDITVPLGETSDYVSDVSWLGFSMQWRQFINNNISLGGSFSWNVLYSRTFETQSFQFTPDGSDREINGDLTGEQFRYLNSFPILFETYYHVGDPYDSAVRPYAGLGIGVTPIERKTEIGLVAITNTNWHFTLTPEVGALFPLDTVTLFAAASYNYAFKTSDSPDYTYITFNLGMMF